MPSRIAPSYWGLSAFDFLPRPKNPRFSFLPFIMADLVTFEPATPTSGIKVSSAHTHTPTSVRFLLAAPLLHGWKFSNPSSSPKRPRPHAKRPRPPACRSSSPSPHRAGRVLQRRRHLLAPHSGARASPMRLTLLASRPVFPCTAQPSPPRSVHGDSSLTPFWMLLLCFRRGRSGEARLY